MSNACSCKCATPDVGLVLKQNGDGPYNATSKQYGAKVEFFLSASYTLMIGTTCRIVQASPVLCWTQIKADAGNPIRFPSLLLSVKE
ncbi:hypothetical protein HPP92_005003 [Vanilla planifolia]|uniref:Uncharacterized protein n=1 Tax=Vanilla planifolia TaxID=51239 RepID=A0A835RRD7_VANPL|nr:hypothetical protein HPP92_005003 [Vanilla planifolia]